MKKFMLWSWLLLTAGQLFSQSKISYNLIFSQKPSFQNNIHEKAQLKSIVFPGFSISYDWRLWKYPDGKFTQKFVVGSLVNMSKFHVEKELLSDGWESSFSVPMFSPFIGYGINYKKLIRLKNGSGIKYFISPRVDFFIPFNNPVNVKITTNTQHYHVLKLFGVSGFPIRLTPTLEGGLEYVFNPKSNKSRVLILSYSFSGMRIWKGKFVINGTNFEAEGTAKYRANSLFIGFGKYY